MFRVSRLMFGTWYRALTPISGSFQFDVGVICLCGLIVSSSLPTLSPRAPPVATVFPITYLCDDFNSKTKRLLFFNQVLNINPSSVYVNSYV